MLAGVVVVLAVLVSLSARAQEGGKRTLGPGTCASGPCHDVTLQWWQSDAHFGSAQPFIDQAGKYKTVAARLKLSLDDAAAVNRRCMTCHGTVLTGAEKKLVEEGVSCESCHGPAGSWKDPHQDKMSSYAKLESAGMNRVDQPPVRDRICVDCHYIVDQELLRAGHPYGWGKDDIGKYTAGIERRISDKRHWKQKVISAADRDPAPFLARVTAKGDVPFIPPPEGLPTTGGGGGPSVVYVERDCGGGGGGGKSSLFFPSGGGAELEFPELGASLAPDSLAAALALVQGRLETLYRLLASSP